MKKLARRDPIGGDVTVRRILVTESEMEDEVIGRRKASSANAASRLLTLLAPLPSFWPNSNPGKLGVM